MTVSIFNAEVNGKIAYGKVVGGISLPSNRFDGVEIWDVIPEPEEYDVCYCGYTAGKLVNTNTGEVISATENEGVVNYQTKQGVVQIQFAWSKDEDGCESNWLEVTVMD